MQKNFKNFSDVRAICPFYLGWTRKGTCCAANR